MRFRLIESFIYEGKNLERTYEQYKDKISKILSSLGIERGEEGPRDIFGIIIKMDPTYRQGSTTTGDYGTWLLNMYINGSIDDYDDFSEHQDAYYGANTPSIHDLLVNFTELKPVMKQKDINQYKSVRSLYDALQNVELTPRQYQRQLRNSLQDASIEFEDTQWTVWVPHSYAASCTLGNGTRWCTAYSKDSSQYDRYSSLGDLYVIINNSNPKEKYQFHFETDSYMDSDDVPVDMWKLFDADEKLYEFFHEKYPRIVNKNHRWVVVYNIDDHSVEDIVSSTNLEIGNNTLDILKLIKDYTESQSVQCDVINLIISDDEYKKIHKDDLYVFRKMKSFICSSIIEVEQEALRGMSSLENVDLGHCKTIGVGAFYNCHNLSEINIFDCTSIRAHAFSGCSNLRSIYIPCATYVGWQAFESCPIESAVMNEEILENHKYDTKNGVDSDLKDSGLDYENIYIDWVGTDENQIGLNDYLAYYDDGYDY